MVQSNTRKGESPGPVGVAIMTLSDVDSGPAVEAGDMVRQVIKDHGHSVVRAGKVACEHQEVQRVLREAIEDRTVDSVILVGGTGLGRRDVALEAVEPFEEKVLPGFGEMLRLIDQRRQGMDSLRTRATAFVSEGKVVFCVPGSPHIAKLAAENLIAPELVKVLSEARS